VTHLNHISFFDKIIDKFAAAKQENFIFEVR